MALRLAELQTSLGKDAKSKIGQTWDIVPNSQTSLPPLKLGTLIWFDFKVFSNKKIILN